MAHPFRHTFDKAAYLSKSPAAAAELDAGDADAAYEHMVTHCASSEAATFRTQSPQPTVSVVVPCYQAEAFLEYTLESVRRQTYASWECIAVDDFSTDKTLGIIKKFIAKDKRFKVLPHRANGGLSAARNSGIRSARGTFVCFLDSDDLMMPTSLENRVRALVAGANERLAGSYSASLTIDESCKTPPSESPAKAMKLVDFTTAGGRCPFNANQPMFKTAVLRRLGGFDQRLKQAEDWDLWMRVLRHGYYMIPTGMTDVTYRARAASMVRSAPLAHLETALRIYDAAHSPLPESRTYEHAPFVYSKPWVEYKRQLDIARRVLEFSGMALSAGQANGTAVDISARALPDFFDAIVSHRDVSSSVHSGVKRQMVGVSDDASRYAAQLLVNDYVATWRARSTPTDKRPSIGSYPTQVGLDVAEQRRADIVFLPHKDYHVWSFSLILDALREAGLRFTFVDLTVIYRDEGARRKLDELGLPRVSYNEFVLGNYHPRMIVCMNDWDPIVGGIVRNAKKLGIPTVGVVEGVQDYLDADTGRVRAPYRTVDYVLLPGEFDARYFPDGGDRVRVGGVPRIDELLEEKNQFPERPLVVINSNFTYNVLTEHRDKWVRMIVDACSQLGYDYLISRHPADKGDFSAYHVADESMYDLIRRGSVFVSRFGSGILESLAMGKPSIYFNPHGEKVDKFTEPNGAFPISLTFDELVDHLRDTVDNPQTWLAHADDYVALHCGTRRGERRTATQRLAAELIDIARSAPCSSFEKRGRLKYLLMAKDERVLGPETLHRSNRLGPDVRRTSGDTDAGWSFRRGAALMNDQSYQERLNRIRRKYRKLRRDPKAFFGDSRLGPIKALKRLF